MLESTGRPSTGELDDAVEESSNATGPKGIFISRRLIASHLLIVSIALTTVALTVYYFGIKCQNFDNVTPILEVSTEIPTQTAKTMVVDVRLPRNLLPLHYDIRLLPWMEEGNFTTDGFIQILLECVKTTNKIVLHSTDIEIDRTSVQVIKHIIICVYIHITNFFPSTLKMPTLFHQIVNAAENHDVIEIDRFEEDTDRQFFIIHLKSFNLLPGCRYNISMDFVGSLNDQQRGFYRDSYIENGEKK